MKLSKIKQSIQNNKATFEVEGRQLPGQEEPHKVIKVTHVEYDRRTGEERQKIKEFTETQLNDYKTELEEELQTVNQALNQFKGNK